MQELMAAIGPLQTATETFAALGARLSIGATDDVAPEIVASLDEVLAAAGFPDVSAAEPQQRMMMLGLVRTMFAQASDMLASPTREAGWWYTDPVLLEGIGRASMMMPALMAGAPELKDVSSLLDIGTGVGLLAISATRTWPGCTVVGIDTWEPSLELARRNVRGANLDNRIELRKQDVVELDDVERFDCAWFPTFFFTRETIVNGLARIRTALTPGGYVVLGHHAPPVDPLARATNRLRTIRDGGSVLESDDAAELLRESGYEDVHALERTSPIPIGFMIGRG
jgi:SAM-dependent methyltransferase